MKLFLSDRFKIAIHVGEPGKSGILTVYAINLVTHDTYKVFESEHISLDEILKAIKLVLKPCPSEEAGDIYQILLLHIEQYKGNMYGFHVSEVDVSSNSGFSFFLEQYIRRFSIEISCWFDLASHDQITLLEKRIASEIDNVGRDYEDAIELKNFYDAWKEARAST